MYNFIYTSWCYVKNMFSDWYLYRREIEYIPLLLRAVSMSWMKLLE